MSTVATRHPGFAKAGLNPKGQTLESLNHIVAEIVKLAGCGNCGRIAYLRAEFLSDPPPELAGGQVISFEVG